MSSSLCFSSDAVPLVNSMFLFFPFFKIKQTCVFYIYNLLSPVRSRFDASWPPEKTIVSMTIYHFVLHNFFVSPSDIYALSADLCLSPLCARWLSLSTASAILTLLFFFIPSAAWKPQPLLLYSTLAWFVLSFGLRQCRRQRLFFIPFRSVFCF